MTRLIPVCAVILMCFPVMADVETTAVLPQGIYSSKFIYGTYTGLDERFDSAGLLEGVADQYHLDLTGSSLSKLDPQLQNLVNVLNHFSSTESLGSELSLGTLDFRAYPVVQYFAPTFAYGLTPNFSIGFGIPIVHFHNSMTVQSSGGNILQLSQFVSGASADVTSALGQLVGAARNMTAALNATLVSRGYLPIRDEDYTALGDLVISGVYRYYASDLWRLALRPFVQLPTGQKDNPNDLVDVATGGQPAVGLYSIHELQLNPRMTWVSSIGYQANIEDTVEMRVPTSLDDILPGPDRLDTVRRKTGNSVYLETGASFLIYRPLQFTALYDFTQKDPDWYDGDRGWDYDILGVDTACQIHQVKAVLEFSSVEWYRKKILSVPFLFGYIYGNTLYAVNAPDQSSHQLYLRMFF